MGSCFFDVNPLCHFVCLSDVLAFDVIPWAAPGSYSSLLSTEGGSAICALSCIFLSVVPFAYLFIWSFNVAKSFSISSLLVNEHIDKLDVDCFVVFYCPFEGMKNAARELDVVEFNTEWRTGKFVLCDDHLSEDVRAGESRSYVILDQARWKNLRARGSHTVVTLFQMLKMGPAWFVLITNVSSNTFHVSNVSREEIQLNSNKYIVHKVSALTNSSGKCWPSSWEWKTGSRDFSNSVDVLKLMIRRHVRVDSIQRTISHYAILRVRLHVSHFSDILQK